MAIREAARTRGRLGGRPETFTPKDLDMLQTLVSNGKPIKDITAIWNVPHTTIYRYLDKEVDTKHRFCYGLLDTKL